MSAEKNAKNATAKAMAGHLAKELENYGEKSSETFKEIGAAISFENVLDDTVTKSKYKLSWECHTRNPS